MRNMQITEREEHDKLGGRVEGGGVGSLCPSTRFIYIHYSLGGGSHTAPPGNPINPR